MKKLVSVSWLNVCLMLGVAPNASAEQVFSLIIGVHPSVPYSSSQAGKTLTHMRDKLFEQCGMIRFPNVRRIELSDKLPEKVIMDTNRPKHMNSYRKTGTSIQVVPFIATCGKDSPIKGFIGGCAVPGGPILVVKRPSRKRDAQIWGHEIGHAQGLNSKYPGYINGHNPNFGFLMYASANQSNWAMSSAECSQYYTVQTFPPKDQGEAIIIDEPLAIKDEQNKKQDEEISFDDEQFARSYLSAEWPHGLDLSVIGDRDELVARLAFEALRENDVELWPNSVLVAGYNNFDDALPLIEKVLGTTQIETDFAAENPEEAAYLINDAKMNAGVALGYLAFEANETAAQLLLQLISPNNNINSIPFADDGRDLQALSQNLAIMATTGLSLAASKNSDLQSRFESHQNAARAGQYDLGVDDLFFDQLNELSIEAQGKSLTEVLSSQ